MLENLLNYEREAFLWLNGSHNPMADQFWWLFSGKTVWIPLALSFVYLIFSNHRPWKEALAIVVAIAITITLCDQFASSFCKPVFERFRPTHHPDFMNDVQIVFGYRGGRYGFISSHAANAFGFVMFTALLLQKRLYTIIMFAWATLTAYSRIYLGVHFISDIVPGILVGLFLGWFVYKLFIYTTSHFINKDSDPKISEGAPSAFRILYTIMGATIFFMLTVSYLYACNYITALSIK